MSDHEDYAPPPPSPRHRACIAIAEWLASQGMSNGLDGRHHEGRYRFVEWAKAGVGRGQVSVYSEKYVRVWWRADVPGLPPEGERVLPGWSEALSFMDLAFVRKDATAALSVPTYQYKRGPRAPATVPPGGPPANFKPAPAASPPGTAYEVPADFLGGPEPPGPAADDPRSADLGGLLWDDL